MTFSKPSLVFLSGTDASRITFRHDDEQTHATVAANLNIGDAAAHPAHELP